MHDSGETYQGGHITKEGRRDLRGVMVEAAWVALEHHPHWKAQFERLTTRKLMNWIAHTGVTPGQHRDRLLLLYQHLDELGLSNELEEINYYGTTYRLSVRQKLLREA